MDKYQAKLLERNKQFTLESGQGNGQVELADSEIVLTQNENYNVKKYELIIINDAIETIQLDGKTIQGNESFKADIDFDNKAKKIIISFKNGFANPCEFNVRYVEANKTAYDQKVAAQNNAECLANMNATCKTGVDLVNIYWNKASENYAYTKIALFVYVENQKSEYLFMQEFKIDNEIFYKSVTGLALGDYKVKVSQFNSNNNLIVSTEVKFSITNPLNKKIDAIASKLDEVRGQVKASGRHTVVI